MPKQMNATLLSRITAVALAGTASLVLYAPVADATPYTVLPRLPACDPAVQDCRLPTPVEVSGKEYSHDVDIDDTQPTPVADPEQVLAWDGIGGRQDTFDYTGSRPGDTTDRQVDALANNHDLLYHEVIADTVWLLFSTEDDPNIYYEDPKFGVVPTTVTGGTWATPPQIDVDGDTHDVDGLEVWGEDLVDDADRYSVQGDAYQGVSVWDYNSASNVSSALWTQAEIARIVSNVTGVDIGLLVDIDLDAMMTYGDSEILFSVAPVAGLDGGEIFVASRDNGLGSWDGVGDTASYLVHGGHVWDTDFDVRGYYGTATENVNALEAVSVPAPATLLLLGFGLAGLGATRRRP